MDNNDCILVTGYAGFIGSHVVESLIPEEKIIGIDNFNDYYNPQLKELNQKNLINNKNFKAYRGDIQDKKLIKTLFKKNKINKIIHLAARAGVRQSIIEPSLYYETNVNGTLNLLNIAQKFEIEKFLFASSSSVYGNEVKIPFSEDVDTSKPISPYAASKKAGEVLCHTFSHLFNLNITCLRFFTVYGPRGRPDMAPLLFLDKILKNQQLEIFGSYSSQRDYTYISDIVTGIKGALYNKTNSYDIFNLGNSNPVPLNEFIQQLENVTGKKAKKNIIEKRPGDVNTTYADITKAQRCLSYKPIVNLKEGLEKLYDWYFTNNIGKLM
ncbi:MAG: GDP-mannose 4,6-dehydratase [Candidatus Hodarchaeales archaeon]|jgi:UDP-glucuronate 4-epimerase